MEKKFASDILRVFLSSDEKNVMQNIVAEHGFEKKTLKCLKHCFVGNLLPPPPPIYIKLHLSYFFYLVRVAGWQGSDYTVCARRRDVSV